MVLYTAIIGRRQVLRWDSIAGFYLFCFTLAFFLRPWYIFEVQYNKLFYQLGLEPFQDWWSWDDLGIKLGIAIILGLSCFALAYRKMVHNNKDSATVALSDAANLKSFRAVVIKLSLVLAALATICILYYHAFPGIRDAPQATWVVLPDYSGRGFSGTTGYLVNMEKFAIPAGVIFLLATGNIVLTLALLVPFLGLRLWWGWYRQGLVHLALSLAVAAKIAPFSRKVKRRAAIGVAVLLFLAAALLGILGEQRNAFQAYLREHSGALTQYIEKNKEGYLNSLVGFEISLHWLKYSPEKYPFTWGSNYFYQLFILPIPRVLWPGKHNIFAAYTPATYEDLGLKRGYT
ncbi:MAG: hypothetical protein K6T55_12780 [Syntrophobacterales bacterium]|nr:hypothetical protein [Syntrophobacterales bacterium]